VETRFLNIHTGTNIYYPYIAAVSDSVNFLHEELQISKNKNKAVYLLGT
jgi:hypothetical protein